MATFFRKRDKWHAVIRRKGVRSMDRAFLNRKSAETWARRVEAEIDAGIFRDTAASAKVTMRELFERYGRATAGIKRNARHEESGLRLLDRHFGQLSLAGLTQDRISDFRDSRLKNGLAPSTVRNNLHLLSAVVRTAINDWGYELPYNPVRRVSKPKVNNARDRRLEAGEEERLLKSAERSRNSEVRQLIILALESAMRLGEMLAIRWSDVDYGKRQVFLAQTKNGRPRRVPLSLKAMEALKSLPRAENDGDRRVFHQWKAATSFQHMWGRLLRRAGIENLHFHDLRHEAASRFAEKGMDIMRIASITGHESMQMLKRYTHFRTADLARELDRPYVRD